LPTSLFDKRVVNEEEKVLDQENSQLIQQTNSFVWRPTEPTAWDFDKAALAAIGDVDDTWYDLDLSSIVPSGADGVIIRIEATDNLAGSHFEMRKNGQTSTFQVACITSSVGNKPECDIFTIGVDSDGKIEFNADPKASDWVSIDLVVLAWYTKPS